VPQAIVSTGGAVATRPQVLTYGQRFCLGSRAEAP
jgi:hypothetical protein